MRSSGVRGQTPGLGLFLVGAVVGAAVAYLTTKESGEERRMHVDDWLKDHGLDAHHMVDRLKKLLHVRKNGHGFVGNGRGKSARRHI